jgi:hypothetical protein
MVFKLKYMVNLTASINFAEIKVWIFKEDFRLFNGRVVVSAIVVTGHVLSRQQFCVKKKLHYDKYEAGGKCYV